MANRKAFPDRLTQPSEVAAATRALELCRRGAVQEGIALYRDIVKSEYLPRKLPIALHLRLLHQLGLNEAVAAIRREALRAGYDLCLSLQLGKPPAEVAAEYRGLFAQGICNAAMLANYLIQLSKLGETSELASFVDAARFIRRTEISSGGDEGSGGKFWESIAVTLAENRTDENWQVKEKSVRRMHLVRHLECNQHPVIQRLLGEFYNQVGRFIGDLRAQRTRIAPWLPQDFAITAWATISSGDGYNTPHIHPKGWLSGVFYVAGPHEVGIDGNPLGALRIGRPQAAPNAAGWPELAIAPKPGTLVLMPSYLTHWTVPLGKPGLRISIAFDVIDL